MRRLHNFLRKYSLEGENITESSDLVSMQNNISTLQSDVSSLQSDVSPLQSFHNSFPAYILIPFFEFDNVTFDGAGGVSIPSSQFHNGLTSSVMVSIANNTKLRISFPALFDGSRIHAILDHPAVFSGATMYFLQYNTEIDFMGSMTTLEISFVDASNNLLDLSALSATLNLGCVLYSGIDVK